MVARKLGGKRLDLTAGQVITATSPTCAPLKLGVTKRKGRLCLYVVDAPQGMRFDFSRMDLTVAPAKA